MNKYKDFRWEIGYWALGRRAS